MSTTMSVSEARAALPRIVDLVWEGEEITLTRHGKPVAVVVRPDRLRPRRAEAAMATAERVRQLIDEGASLPLDSAPGLTQEQADDLVAEVRRSRESR